MIDGINQENRFYLISEKNRWIFLVNAPALDNNTVAFFYDLDLDGLVLVWNFVYPEFFCFDKAFNPRQIRTEHPLEIITFINNFYHGNHQ